MPEASATGWWGSPGKIQARYSGHAQWRGLTDALTKGRPTSKKQRHGPPDDQRRVPAPTMRPLTHARVAVALLLLGALALTVAAYLPALPGPLIFDDGPNLAPLLAASRDNVYSLAHFVLSGTAGPTGRPIALASFALDYRLFGPDPLNFRATNLVLHVLTGLLIFLLFARLTTALRKNGRGRWDLLPAAITASVWLLHPLNVSTTLYVVQRMTQLGALFTLCGLLAYTHGRMMWPQDPSRGRRWAIGGLALFTVLATLSKETGALLPLYAAVVELTIFRRTHPVPPGRNQRLLNFSLIAPLAVLVGLMGLQALSFSNAARAFSIGDRLLTEARVLIEYLGQIFLPRTSQLGLFHDDYTVSVGMLSPWTTLPSLTAVVALLTLSVRWRAKEPALALAITWFFAGHVLEATVIPLELYFEHRNYLPMVGPLFALAYYACEQKKPLGFARAAGGALVMLTIMVIGFATARAWQNPSELASLWAFHKPGSVRATSLDYTVHQLPERLFGGITTNDKIYLRIFD